MKKRNPTGKKLHTSINGDVEKMRRLLAAVEKSLESAEKFSRTHGLYGCHRTLLHMISHAQTLTESLRSKKASFD